MIWRVSTKYTYRKDDRLAGDTELQNNIDKEATERANQDTLINNALAQEKADRIAADQALDSKKVDKVDGKVLSSNDFTDLLFAKLDGIEEHANYITKVSELLNDSDFQNSEQVEAAIQRLLALLQRYLILWLRLLRLSVMTLTLQQL